MTVFPTCVGVFLRPPLIASFGSSLPHMRGGVSTLPSADVEGAGSSPHAWGCFYFITDLSG